MAEHPTGSAARMIGSSRIETPRLLLVPYSPEQLLALVEEPARFEELTGFAAAQVLCDFLVSDDVSPSYLDELRSSSGEDPWLHGFAVVHRARGCIVGNGAFKGPPDAKGMVEIAYRIVPAFADQGIATETAQALVAWAFAVDHVHLVRAHTRPVENASDRVLSKTGFRWIGEIMDPEDGLIWRWERGR